MGHAILAYQKRRYYPFCVVSSPNCHTCYRMWWSAFCLEGVGISEWGCSSLGTRLFHCSIIIINTYIHCVITQIIIKYKNNNCKQLNFPHTKSYTQLKKDLLKTVKHFCLLKKKEHQLSEKNNISWIKSDLAILMKGLVCVTISTSSSPYM